MRIDVVTLFPSMVDIPLSESIIGRARKKGILTIGFSNPRDFASGRHKTVDDRPYGGGPGMLMMADPLYKALAGVRKKNSTVIMLAPGGETLDQAVAGKLALKKHLVLICGHYEGVDERFLEKADIDMQLSVGDYILTGGEAAAVVVVDCVARLLPGALGREDSAVEESFRDSLLETPQYTRPAVWKGLKVPPVLLSGNHSDIAGWRREQAIRVTGKRRPDLLRRYKMEEACKRSKG